MSEWYQCKSCAKSVTCKLREDPDMMDAIRIVGECWYYEFRPSTKFRSTYR